MTKGKISVKLLVILEVILLTICLFGINEVNATESDDEYAKSVIDSMPDTITLDYSQHTTEENDEILQNTIEELKNVNDGYEIVHQNGSNYLNYDGIQLGIKLKNTSTILATKTILVLRTNNEVKTILNELPNTFQLENKKPKTETFNSQSTEYMTIHDTILNKMEKILKQNNFNYSKLHGEDNYYFLRLENKTGRRYVDINIELSETYDIAHIDIGTYYRPINVEYGVNPLDAIPNTIEVENVVKDDWEPTEEMKNEIKSYLDEDVAKHVYMYFRGNNNGTLEHLTKIRVYYSNYEKVITVKYNNSNWSETDKAYVENRLNGINLQLGTVLDDIETCGCIYDGIGNDREDSINYFTNFFKETLKDVDVDYKFFPNHGDWVWGEDPVMGGALIFSKNGVVYCVSEIFLEAKQIMYIPANIADNEQAIVEYATNKIKEYYKTIKYGVDDDIITVKKGTKENEYTCNLSSWNDSYFTFTIIKEETKPLSSTDTTTNIKLEADTSVVPEDTKLVAEKITQGTTYKVVAESLKDNIEKFVLYDITLSSNNVSIQPSGKVKISLPIPTGYDTSKIVVYRVAEDGTKTKYDTTVKDGYVTIETDHFSNYVVAEETTTKTEEKTSTPTTTETTTTSTAKELDETPKTGTNDMTSVIAGMVSLISIAGLAVIKRF